MAPFSNSNLYDVLGVERDASPSQIRRAYRQRALETHPDRLPSGVDDKERTAANEQFRIVNNAYEVLSNEENRRLYDRHGVWPPPENQHREQHWDDAPPEYFDSRIRRHRSRRHSSSPWPSGNPFDAPFFGFGNTAFNHRDFRFTDPFELFNRVFRDMEESMMMMHLDAFNNNAPFRPSPSFASTSLFGTGVERGFDPFFRMTSIMPSSSFLRNASVDRSVRGNGYHYTTSETYTQSINGVTHTVKRRVDSNGDEHVTQIYPDGRKVRYLNGLEQPTGDKITLDENTVTVTQPKKRWWR